MYFVFKVIGDNKKKKFFLTARDAKCKRKERYFSL